ncbi:helix-turn-helix domain-containing protein [Phaeospirillum tilakii]|uniref:Multiprotein-bridging factor 1 family protein n=1 Tax=Phaeospirillum tilakii TaxID=741673 RepID=A0ABW5CF59_9PROT
MINDAYPRQLRAARALAGMSRADLAMQASTTERTIARIEDGDSSPRASTLAAIHTALEAAGVEFIDDGGPGVRLKEKAA